MDPMYLALSLFRRRKYDKCAEICTEILDRQPLDQAAWCLKMRALTQRVYVDDIESEELFEGDFLDDNAVATAPRPGTSIKTAIAATAAMSSRPRTSTGRPISGVARPGTQMRPGSALERLKTARPITGQSARAIRLGTAAMYTQKEGPFIQVSRLNIAKYAKNQNLNKPLFEYLFFHEGDVRNAMELAVQATQSCDFQDWWWKVQLSKCYIVLNLIRDAEQQMRSALKQHYHIETFIRLTRIYLRLDQPLSAVEICRAGLEIFPNDVSIMTELARLYETLNETASSVKYYRSIVIEDAMNTEAIACIGMYHFYNNQPELALRYYSNVEFRLLTFSAVGHKQLISIHYLQYIRRRWSKRTPSSGNSVKRAHANQGKADRYIQCKLYPSVHTFFQPSSLQPMGLRVLAMGAHSAELYNNLGLCCLYSQQLDLTLACFQRALDLAIDPLIKAEVWYNLSHLALAAGDLELALQCLNLCLSSDSTHASAFNNLAVLHYKTGRTNLAKAYFTSAKGLEPNLYEPRVNLEFLQNP